MPREFTRSDNCKLTPFAYSVIQLHCVLSFPNFSLSTFVPFQMPFHNKGIDWRERKKQHNLCLNQQSSSMGPTLTYSLLLSCSSTHLEHFDSQLRVLWMFASKTSAIHVDPMN